MKALYESRAAQWGAAVLVAAVLCCSYPLMYAYRTVRQSQQPQLAAQWANDGRFTMLAVFGGEHVQEEAVSAARTREAAVRWLPYDAYVKENKSVRLLITDYLTYRIMALPYFVFRNMDATWLFWRLMCAVLWFILIYRLGLRATGSAPEALFCAVLVTCFSYLLTLQFLTQMEWTGNPLRALMHDAWAILSYGRTEGLLRLPRPGFTYAALYLACHLAIRTAERTERRWVVFSGIAGGLLAYIRLDPWSMYLGTMGAFAVLQSYRKKALDYRLFASLGISFILSLPYVWAILTFSHETLRTSLVKAPVSYDYSAWAYLLGCGILLRYRKEPVHIFLASMLGFMFFFLHAPLVTGLSLSPDHWKFIANIFFFIAIVSLLPKAWKSWRGAWETAAVAMLAIALLQGASFAALHYEFFGFPRDIQGGMDWLARNAKPDSVVLALDPEINTLIPVLTPSKDLIAPYRTPLISDLPLSNNVDRIRYGLSLLGADEKRFVRETILEGHDVDRRDYTSANREGAQTTLMMNMALGHSRQEFADLFKSEKPVDRGSFSGPDYVWIGPFERKYAAAGFPGKDGRWTEVYRSGGVALYKAMP